MPHSPGAGPMEAGGDGVSSTAPQLHTDLQPRPLHVLPARPLPVQARATRAGRVPASSSACTRSATSRRPAHTSWCWLQTSETAACTGRRPARCPALRCCAARWPDSSRVPAACARQLRTKRPGAMAMRTGRASGAAPARLARSSRRSICRPRRRRVLPNTLAKKGLSGDRKRPQAGWEHCQRSLGVLQSPCMSCVRTQDACVHC